MDLPVGHQAPVRQGGAGSRTGADMAGHGTALALSVAVALAGLGPWTADPPPAPAQTPAQTSPQTPVQTPAQTPAPTGTSHGEPAAPTGSGPGPTPSPTPSPSDPLNPGGVTGTGSQVASGSLPTTNPDLVPTFEPSLLVITDADSAPTMIVRSRLRTAEAAFERSRTGYLTAKARAARTEGALRAAQDRVASLLQQALDAVQQTGSDPKRREAWTKQVSEVGVLGALAGALDDAIDAPLAADSALTAHQGAATALAAAARMHGGNVLALQKAITTVRASMTYDRDVSAALAAWRARQQLDEQRLLSAVASARATSQLALAAELESGLRVATSDGQVVTSIKPGTTLPGTGRPASKEVSTWIAEALAVLYKTGFPRGSDDALHLAIIIDHESAGRPTAINLTDSNALKGDPSFGLMQTIGATFRAWALPGYQLKGDPVAQIIAGARYGVNRYGSLAQIPGVAAVLAGQPYRPY